MFIQFKSGKGIIIVGVMVFALALFMFLAPKGEYQEVEAVVSDIRVGSDIINNPKYKCFIDYMVNDRQYRGISFDSCLNGTTIGDKITVEYNVENPELVRAKDSEKLPLVFLTVGVF